MRSVEAPGLDDGLKRKSPFLFHARSLPLRRILYLCTIIVGEIFQHHGQLRETVGDRSTFPTNGWRIYNIPTTSGKSIRQDAGVFPQFCKGGGLFLALCHLCRRRFLLSPRMASSSSFPQLLLSLDCGDAGDESCTKNHTPGAKFGMSCLSLRSEYRRPR